MMNHDDTTQPEVARRQPPVKPGDVVLPEHGRSGCLSPGLRA